MIQENIPTFPPIKCIDFINNCWRIFNQSIQDYHRIDDIDVPIQNPYPKNDLQHLLYLKNWIDTIQWHLEDLIRDPKIDPKEGMKLKYRIDASNQERTDLVESIDVYFLNWYQDTKPLAGAKINTESPAWTVDRLSILALKIYHMEEQVQRSYTSLTHKNQCRKKLYLLQIQQEDLFTAIEELLEDIQSGRKYIKVYKQMKMYNDETLNPILYKNQ
ncbi:MAG: DUF4254 domain-containing protein [Flavobacteriales bacterium AspAUS03]